MNYEEIFERLNIDISIIEEEYGTIEKYIEYTNNLFSFIASGLFSKRKLQKIQRKIASMPPEKVKRKFRRLLITAAKYKEEGAFKKAMFLIYPAANEELKKELLIISNEIQQKYILNKI